MIIDGNRIKAENDMILTDGVAYGRSIRLGEGRSAEEFYEITKAEYEQTIINIEQEV
jgi:hypothetical protein